MDFGVDDEGGPVDGSVSDHEATVVADQVEIRHLDLREGHSSRIDPEMVGQLRVPHGDVAGGAVIETQLAEHPESTGETLLAVQALLLDVVEHGIRRQRDVADMERLGGELGTHLFLLCNEAVRRRRVRSSRCDDVPPITLSHQS